MDEEKYELTKKEKEQLDKTRKKVNSMQRQNNISTGLSIIAPATAAAFYKNYLSQPTRKFGEFAAETADGIKMLRRLFDRSDSSQEGLVEEYLARIPSKKADQYLDYTDQGLVERLKQGTETVIEAGGRASENFPTSQTKPVQGLRSLKGRILQSMREKVQTLKGESKEQAKTRSQISNTPIYQENWNKLGELRLQGAKTLDELEEGIVDYCQEIAVQEARTGDTYEKGAEKLEKLVTEYNQIARLMENSKVVTPEEIHAGLESSQYQAIISQADDYGIKAPDYGRYGTIADNIGLGTSMVVAYLLARPVVRTVTGLVGAGEKIGKVAYKTTKKAIDAVKSAGKKRKS